jgi:hypothetical protein
MSFQPANFTDVRRSGPPTTANGSEWKIPISTQPPDEWLGFLRRESDADSSVVMNWIPNVRVVQLEFTCTADSVPSHVETLDRWISRANDQYRSWLEEVHRKGSERRRGAQTEADRVRDLNERFKNL